MGASSTQEIIRNENENVEIFPKKPVIEIKKLEESSSVTLTPKSKSEPSSSSVGKIKVKPLCQMQSSTSKITSSSDDFEPEQFQVTPSKSKNVSSISSFFKIRSQKRTFKSNNFLCVLISYLMVVHIVIYLFF